MKRLATSPYDLLMIGQYSLLIALAVCITIEPSYLLRVNQGGISNYGTLWTTLIPYSIGFWAAGLLTLQAARVDGGFKPSGLVIQTRLRILGSLYILLALSTYPYQLNSFWRSIHELLAISLFVYGLYFCTWLLINIGRSPGNVIGYSILIFGFVLSGAAFFNVVTLLLYGELLAVVGLALFLKETLKT